jgi:single-stranded DNA-binding protein
MNNLNSVLFEGTVGEGRLRYSNKGIAWYTNTVTGTRTVKNIDDDPETTTTTVPIWAKSHLAEVCNEYLTPGRGVRIVGRIEPDGDGGLRLYAEHVEFKPVYTPAQAPTVETAI